MNAVAVRAVFVLIALGATLVLCTSFARAANPAPEADAATGFVTGIPDLPLVAGLTEDTEAGLVFDKPSGRIVEATASGPLKRAGVVAFYVETLPELGWRRVEELAFAREGEVLRIAISGDDGDLIVRFSLAPR